MADSLEKFQQLLRELFQFDCADLDFGIYRIMNHKRDVVERFITQDLPWAVAAELERGALAEQDQAAKELADARRKVLDALSGDALAPDGTLAEKYLSMKAGKEYLAAQAKAAGSRGREAIEAAIYNHLYAFFSRYYLDGDFISKRRYSKRERYAIPYNGEEVYLYWANHDQYYVKTAEYFTDYTFTAPNGVSVHFKLQAADVEQDNVKGEKRFFLPRPAEIAWDEAARQLVIPFEYRPLTEQENIAYGQKNQQEAILAEAVEKIPKRLSPKTAAPALAALTAEKRQTSDGQPVTYLEHHLRQYTRRNTADFFIHKDLKGFLSRELDFYLKNEVLNLDELSAAGQDRAEGWFQVMHLIQAVGGRIIEFLHQIEEFQKMLWEKRKFITETGYCITVGNIAEEFYPEIAACEPQWAEWKELFHIDEQQAGLFNAGNQAKRIAFLKAHPTLVLDTRHFDRDFVDRLLASFDDLDEMTDGLLVHSENWQALNLLVERYRETVKCIYIDPPYNTGSDGFAFKDSYQQSSWLAMIHDRLIQAAGLLCSTGVVFINIDDIEFPSLTLLVQWLFGGSEVLVWKKAHDRYGKMKNTLSVRVEHDYVVLGYRGEKRLNKNRVLPRFSQKPKRDARGEFYVGYIARGEEGSNIEHENFYEVTAPNGKTFRAQFFVSPEEFHDLDGKGRIYWTEAGIPYEKIYLDEPREVRLGSLLLDTGTTYDAKKDFSHLSEAFGIWIDQLNPKPTKLISALLTVGADQDSVAIDFFAGSGTTGHAVINLNREDGGQRRFILAEMADYFDTVLLPRLKKVTFTPEWRDGKPKRLATAEEAERSPRIVKYIRLESYEDTLNNIAFDDASGQQAMQFEDYLLQYMLRWETRASETLLNVEKLAQPFSYKLHIHADSQTCQKLVDIPETFNYLLGLHVQTRRVLTSPPAPLPQGEGSGRYLVYRGQIDHRQIAVIWRETAGWQQADFERDRQFVAAHKLSEGADEIFVNGDSLIPGARALEPLFKARLFAPVEA